MYESMYVHRSKCDKVKGIARHRPLFFGFWKRSGTRIARPSRILIWATRPLNVDPKPAFTCRLNIAERLQRVAFVPIFKLSSVSADEHRIVEFLRKTAEFVSVVKISLKVGGRKRCRTSPCWARRDLLRLSTLGILEPDYRGRFRFKSAPKVHLAPQIAEIFTRAKTRLAAFFGT